MYNPLNVFLHPQKTVEAFIEKPNLPVAVLFVTLPSILLLLLFYIYKLDFDLTNWVINFFLKDIVIWVLTAVLIYILVFAIKGWKVEGKLTGILSAVSLIGFLKIILFAMGIVSIAIVYPNLFSIASEIINNWPITTEEMMTKVSEELFMPLGVMGNALLFVVGIIALLIALLALYLIYKIIAVSAPSSTARNILIFVMMLGFLAIIGIIWP